MTVSGTNTFNENVTDDCGEIVPTSQCVWSKITFSKLVTEDEVDATDVWSFCKTISTLFSGALPALEISITTSLFVIEVRAPEIGLRLTILSPVSLNVKAKFSFRSPDSRNLENVRSIVPE